MANVTSVNNYNKKQIIKNLEGRAYPVSFPVAIKNSYSMLDGKNALNELVNEGKVEEIPYDLGGNFNVFMYRLIYY